MATKGEPITTKFSVDISELKAGIQEANRQIKLANSAFKAASSGMDDWSNSADGLQAKLEQLADVQDAENKKLTLLKQQYEQVAAEQGENSAAAQNLMIKINNQQAAVNKTASEFAKYEQKLNDVNSAQNGSSQSATEYKTATDRLKETISEQEKELNDLKAAYTDIALEQGQTSGEARRLAAQIQSLSSDLEENRSDLAEAEAAANHLDESLSDVGNSAEEASGGFTVMKGAIASLIADGLRAAGAAFKDLMTASSEASANFQAQTGASAEEMKKFNAEITDLYKQNFGESMQDVADAMAQVKQQVGDIDPSSLKELTKNAIALRDTFGFEINEQMRAVNMLMTQFGISGEEAFNLIVQGAQNGLDKNGDLLDSINEYSVHYEQLGYTSEEFFNSLINGTESGTFSVDKLGDTMKELGIRTKDTAKSTTEGFELVGLSADEMRGKFAQGGESAREATQQTLDALFGMDDAVKQNQAGVALFGTMWEDLGIEGVKALMDVTGQIDSTDAAMSKLTDAKYSDIGNQFKEIGRIIKVDFLQPLANEALPVIHDFLDYVKTNLPQAKQLFSDLVPAVVGIGTAIATYFVVGKIVAFVGAIKTMITAFATAPTVIAGVKAAMTALNITMMANPIGLIISLIAGLVAGFVLLWTKSEAFREFWIGLWDAIVSFCQTAIDAIVNFFTVTVPQAIDNMVSWFQQLPGRIGEFLAQAKNNVSTWVSNMVAKAIEVGTNFLMNIVNFFQNLPERIGYFIGFALGKIVQWGIDLYNFATTKIPEFVNAVIKFISELPGKIWNWLVQAYNKVVQWGSDMISTGRQKASEFVSSAVQYISELPGKIWAWLSDTVQKVIQWGSDMVSEGKQAASDLVSNVADTVAELPGKMLSIGSDIVHGIWDGISGAAGWLAEKVKGFASGVVEGFKAAFDTHSPSRILRDEVGKWLPAGIGEGITDNEKSAINPVVKLTKKVRGAASKLRDNLIPIEAKNIISSNVRALKGRMTGAAYSASESVQQVKEIVFNQYNTSPKALSRLDIYRQTKNQLFAAKGKVAYV